MEVRVAIAKRRAKTLAAGSILYLEEAGRWWVTLHGVVNDQVAPIGTSQFDTLEEAIADGNEALRVQDADWVLMEAEAVDAFILANARNRWSPKRPGRPPAGGEPGET